MNTSMALTKREPTLAVMSAVEGSGVPEVSRSSVAGQVAVMVQLSMLVGEMRQVVSLPSPTA